MAMPTEKGIDIRAYFLDTSAQIARHWHLPEEQKAIASELLGKALHTCRYVRQQYKATLLNALIVLHNLLQNSDDPLVALERSDYWEEIRSAGGKATPRQATLIRQAGHRLLRMFPDRLATKQEVLDRLRRLIEYDWEALFLDGVRQPLVDNTDCRRAGEAPTRDTLGFYGLVDDTCNIRQPRDCGICAFWGERKLDLVALAEFRGDTADPTRDPKRTMGNVKAGAQTVLDGESPQGQRCSVHLSDTIIALESRHAPQPAAVYATDRDFEPICACLNVPVKVFSSRPTGEPTA